MDKREYGSNLISTGAAAVLLLLFLAAEYYGKQELAVFLAGVFLFSLVALAWSRGALSRVEMQVHARRRTAFPGQTLSFTLWLKNDKWLPLFWLTAALPKAERGILPTWERRMNWLLPWQELRWEQDWEAVRRGVYHLDRVDLYSGDGLGLAVCHREFKLSAPQLFVVYPRVQPVRLSALPRHSAETAAGAQGWLEDVTVLRNNRAYQPGDSIRRVNWRLSARQSELQVNLYETVRPVQITLLLDLASFSDYERVTEDGATVYKVRRFYEAEMEDMISLAASLACALSEKKERVVLMLPRTQLDREKTVAQEDPERAVPAILTALSEIRYQGGPAVWPGWEREGAASLGECLVLSRTRESVMRLGILEKLTEARLHRIVWEAGSHAGSLRFIGRSELLDGG